MSEERSNNASLFWGLFLIAVGAIFLFDNLGMLDFGNIISDFWPLILIAIGARIIWKARNEDEQKAVVPKEPSHTEAPAKSE